MNHRDTEAQREHREKTESKRVGQDGLLVQGLTPANSLFFSLCFLCTSVSLWFILLATAGCQQEKAAAPVLPTPEPELFQDMTAASGVDFTYRNGEEADHYAILESLGGGVALFDYDGDGLLDLYVPGGGYYDGPDRQTIQGHPGRLYRNLGGWKFADVTTAAGLDRPRFYTHGCAVADYDRDGWPDLLVTGWGRLALYHNEPTAQGRHFVEVTARAGLTDRLWSTSAAWGDLDGDGYPELYVCHYVDWSFAKNPRCNGYSSDVPRDVCPPRQFLGLPHVLYRNNRDGTFTDISEAAGLRRAGSPAGDAGKGLGVVMADLDGDRRPEIYVANDTVDNFLYLNRGGGKLEEAGLLRGVAVDEGGVPQGSMGADVGDYDGSGLSALFVTNYENEMHALYRNLGKGQFVFATAPAGIAAIGQRYVGFGTSFLDFDNDGWLDLAISNGHVIRHPRSAGLRQQPVLFHNQGQGKFRAVTATGGPYFRAEHRGRGLAVGDLDNDGWPDLVLSHVNEPVALLRNRGGKAHWLGVALRGQKERDLVGTRLTLEVGGRRLTRFVKGGGSYLSAGDPRLVFGLADAARVERLTVEWSWGETQQFDGASLAVDRYWVLREGEAAPGGPS